jgi:uncharacterized protein YndB with AHSA1/START domain
MSSPDTTADQADREIVLTRVVNASRELVFQVFTEPEHIKHWWGPNGFTNTIHEMDVRPGGVWRFIMHGPDGTNYPNRIDYLEVVKPERLVYDHGDDDGGDTFRATATFTEAGPGQTLVTLTLVLKSADEKRRVVEFGAVEGGQQTLARLDEYVSRM